MSTDLTRLLRRTRTAGRRSAEHAARKPANPSTWSAATLQALAHASALGLFIPPSTWHAPGERQDTR